MVQTDKLQRTEKKTDISYITYLARKRRLSEKTFFYRQREVSSFPESDHIGHIQTQIGLNIDGTN